jgi:hypothetical protein
MLVNPWGSRESVRVSEGGGSSLSVTNEQERDEAGYQDVVYVWLACGWGPKAVVQWGSVEQFKWSL